MQTLTDPPGRQGALMKSMTINGRWLAARDERTMPVISPADGETFEHIPRGTAHEVNMAVMAARAALSGPWVS